MTDTLIESNTSLNGQEDLADFGNFLKSFQGCRFQFRLITADKRGDLLVNIIRNLLGCMLNNFDGVYPLGFSDVEFVLKFDQIRQFCLLEKRHFFFRPSDPEGQPLYNLAFTDVDWAHPRLLEREY
jgi:hypothetical protein